LAIYTDKEALEKKMTKQVVAKLSMQNGAPDDNVVEDCCLTGDMLVLSKISQFYRGAHPIVAPVGLSILQHCASLYATAALYQRDPTHSKTYSDMSKSPHYRQAESIMSQVQVDKMCLYDNATQPFIGAGVVSPDLGKYPCTPQLFGENYWGDLLCQQHVSLSLKVYTIW
jgi:hypothetical protein